MKVKVGVCGYNCGCGCAVTGIFHIKSSAGPGGNPAPFTLLVPIEFSGCILPAEYKVGR